MTNKPLRGLGRLKEYASFHQEVGLATNPVFKSERCQGIFTAVTIDTDITIPGLAKQFNCSKERIRQIIDKALKELDRQYRPRPEIEPLRRKLLGS